MFSRLRARENCVFLQNVWGGRRECMECPPLLEVEVLSSSTPGIVAYAHIVPMDVGFMSQSQGGLEQVLPVLQHEHSNIRLT